MGGVVVSVGAGVHPHCHANHCLLPLLQLQLFAVPTTSEAAHQEAWLPGLQALLQPVWAWLLAGVLRDGCARGEEGAEEKVRATQ